MSWVLTVSVPGPRDSVYCCRCSWLSSGRLVRYCTLLRQRLTPAKKKNAYRCQRCFDAQERTRGIVILQQEHRKRVEEMAKP